MPSIILIQDDFVVGDISGNATKIRHAILEASAHSLLIFPELALCGYIPEDRIFYLDFIEQQQRELADIAASITDDKMAVVGLVVPNKQERGYHNSAALLSKGYIAGIYHKQHLPNHAVFDEKRYFIAGNQQFSFSWQGVEIGLAICEDIWHESCLEKYYQIEVQALVVINASPFYQGRYIQRREWLCQMAAKYHLHLIYVNCVGGQDELVFDGASCVIDREGNFVAQLKQFATDRQDVELGIPVRCEPPLTAIEELWKALVVGLRDYIRKNGLQKIVLGLSGGIDSAVSLAIAVEAVGYENVCAVMMPSRYTSVQSLDLAARQAKNMAVEYREIPIESIFQATLNADAFAKDITQENLQSRIRALLLMALCNENNALLLSTGNRSELAMGYSTIYGDMAGGFNALKGISKTQVYQLANFINSDTFIIPEDVITRAPTAELKENQIDQDSLPAYDILDVIIKLYIEKHQDAANISKAVGMSRDEVDSILRTIDRNEYKRQQSPLGVRITPYGFGKDRRMPVSFYQSEDKGK